MKKILWLMIIVITAILGKLSLAGNDHAGNLAMDTPYQVCFTPGGNCTQVVVDNIAKARSSILVQAYSFTSTPIAQALADAEHRGILVKVILDKSDFSKRYTIATYLSNHGIPVWDDYKPSIAHNKVIVIDDAILITGSFNFTKSAQQHNAENLIVIDSPQLADIYTKNWQRRMSVSEKV